MKKIVAIVQARTSSTRLPNKVLKSLGDSSMLVQQIRRMSKSELLSEIVIATSDEESDNPIQDICEENNFKYFRGSLNDVLSRYYHAALKHKADIVVRVTGDCPLSDPKLIDSIINLHVDKQSKYTSNCRPATFPDGFDVEIFNFDLLEDAYHNAELPSEREHVSPYIVKNIEKLNYEYKEDLSALRVTVDNSEDLSVVREIYEKLDGDKNLFSFEEVIDFLKENPDVSSINSKYERNEGSIKSLEEDKEFLKGINSNG